MENIQLPKKSKFVRNWKYQLNLNIVLNDVLASEEDRSVTDKKPETPFNESVLEPESNEVLSIWGGGGELNIDFV